MSKKVIVIDDSPVARTQVRNALVGAGYNVVEAVDGQDGVDKVRSNEDTAMVICDLNLPGLSGIEVLTAVRAAGRNSSVPFVLLTTEAQPEIVQEAMSKGAKGWILKPVKPSLLVAAVKKLAG